MSTQSESSVQLVITPPGVLGAAFAERFQFRMTLGALTQLLAEARHQVILSAPFLQYGYGLSTGTLADAAQAALKRGVNVDIMSTRRSLENIDRVWLTQQARGTLRLFCTAANIADEEKLGSHAKFCVADGKSAYVGSANLTGPGLSDHLELGLLVDGQIAKQIEAMWLYSIEIGLFVQVD
jgi:phosphatidylserine/phosphatidylglycerophosphate/cardiolipin synthase-like enzyme